MGNYKETLKNRIIYSLLAIAGFALVSALFPLIVACIVLVAIFGKDSIFKKESWVSDDPYQDEPTEEEKLILESLGEMKNI